MKKESITINNIYIEYNYNEPFPETEDSPREFPYVEITRMCLLFSNGGEGPEISIEHRLFDIEEIHKKIIEKRLTMYF